jgi:hypothetical protein
MSKRSNFVFISLHVIAWIIFVGLCIEAGGLIVNFIFNLIKPEFLGNLYQKLNIRTMYDQNQWVFFGMYSFILSIAMLKAHLFYIVIRLLNKLNLEAPFDTYVAKQITKMSYYTFSIGLISLIGQESARNLIHHGYALESLNHFWSDSQAFILMAAVIYVIATIFSRGVELQNENDLTV